MHEESYYYEKISSILITNDNTKIAVLGETYHYIFNAPPLLTQTLAADFGKNLSASFNTFILGGGNTINGKFSLWLNHNASEEAKARATALGFQVIKNGAMRLDLTIDGERFARGQPLPMKQAYKLNNEYSIRIEAPDGVVMKAAKIAVTPITAAADGVLILGAVILSPIWVPILLSNVRFPMK